MRRSLAAAGKSKPLGTGGPAATSGRVTTAGSEKPWQAKLKLIWPGAGNGVTISLAVAKFQPAVPWAATFRSSGMLAPATAGEPGNDIARVTSCTGAASLLRIVNASAISPLAGSLALFGASGRYITSLLVDGSTVIVKFGALMGYPSMSGQTDLPSIFVGPDPARQTLRKC